MPTRVTWMIPVLNGMPYFPLTLASIEAQTFKDFRVIIWDNGSTDGTIEEARRWIPSRIPGRVVTDRPLPLGLARAAMVAECDTEFGALIYADDVNLPERLARQMAFMQDNPDVAVLGSQLRKIDSAGNDLGQLVDYPLSHELIVQEMLRSNPIGQPAVLLRCAAVLAAGNYRDFSPTHVEDYDLWLRMAAMNFRLANLPETLVQYRIHSSSTTQKSINAKRLDAEMLRRLQQAAPELFGCSGETIKRLREKRHPIAAIPLMKIARHLRIARKVKANPWRSSTFCRAASEMIGPYDLLSRIAVWIARRPHG